MALKKHTIPFAETGQFSKLFMNYINGDEKLRSFYTYSPDISSFGQAIADKRKEKINRDLLVEVISDQYKSRIKSPLSDFQASNSNIEKLLNGNTYTVCTGHQLCLFTGPLYFIFKIISTINLAEALRKQYSDCDFVPVYWMASEDHDFEEISSVQLFGRKITWEVPAAGAVGRLKTNSLDKIIDELKQIFGDSENAKALIQLFSDAYLKHDTLADATRYLVHELFSEDGLVIIDPDDARLKSEFIEIIKDDIANQTNFKLVSDTIARLNAIGFEAQVNPREINVFRMTENNRIRIEQANVETLNLKPGEYSPNVVLRPLYQQKILPNLAYVGGPGELAYWLEYKAMFDHHKILFPVLIPRNFAVLMDEKALQQLTKLGFTKSDIFKEADVLIKDFVNKSTGSDLSLKEQEQKLALMFGEMAVKVNAVDPSLKASVEAELQKALGSIKNIESKLLRSEKQKQETNISQIKKLKDKFLPGGVLQERHDNMAPYYLKSGKSLISELKETFDPFAFEMLVLEL
ncbi:MAG TPA: bacillithiol biosynthesis cysteine-adding enzyme BshC [Bacteroidia bacterium]|jgi:bacillithiol biosynthesis cysteine-adding enzyme BshC